MSNKDDILVEVKGVSKKFSRSLKRGMFYGLKDLGSVLLGSNRDRSALREGEFWAVKDVSFSLRRGECLGLIGHNGAGKSTLLKMLNGLIRPDEGSITIRGKVGALIELGAGFNPLLTGRENIYVNGQLLGFSRKEINEKFQAIIDFADIGEFIDSPVQNYSSGMKVRLGFAVAAQMEPDVLIIDEVLAVGDAGFRIKCYNEIYRILAKAAIIFVSHSMPQVGKVCTLGIFLKNGCVQLNSRNTYEVIALYLEAFGSENTTIEGSGKGEIHKITIYNNGDVKTFTQFSETPGKNLFGVLDSAQGVKMEIFFSLSLSVLNFNVLISITDAEQRIIAQVLPFANSVVNKVGVHKLVIDIHDFILNTGKYAFSFHFIQASATEWGETLIGLRSAINFSVRRNNILGSAPVLLEAKWNMHDVRMG